MKPSFFNKTLLNFGIALAILLAIGYVSFQSIERLLQAAEQSKRSSLMTQDFVMLPALAQGIQNAYRGYVITGDEIFLEGYGEMAKALVQKIQQLRRQTGAPAVHQQRLDSLAALVKNIVHRGDEVIHTRRQGGFEAAQRLVMDRQGIQLIHAIEGLAEETATVNLAWLQNEEQIVRAKTHKTEITILFGSLAALLFIGLIGFMLHHENREHRKADAALEKAYGDLAQRNQKLLEANQQLEKEIAERQKMEQQLTFQASILSQVGDAVIAHDRNLQITYWNPMAERLFGWKAEEALGREAPELLRANTTAAEHQKALGLLNQGASLVGETLVHHKDGRRVEIETHTMALRNGQREVIGYVNVNRDLTERRRLEQAIRLQSVIVNNMAEGVCLVRDRDGAIVYVNPKFEEMFGYDSGELINKPVNILNYAGGDPAGVRDAILDSLREKGEAGFEIWNAKKDGTPFWSWAQISGFDHPEHGKVWVAIHQDITERKQAETALQQERALLEQRVEERTTELSKANFFLQTEIIERKLAEEALRAAQAHLQIVADAMPIVVTRCSRELTYLWVNKACEALLQRSAPEIIGHPIAEIFGQESFNRFLPYYQRVLSGERINLEEEVDYQGVGRRWVNAIYTPTFDAAGVPDGWVAVVLDITARKRSENEVRRLNAELEERVAGRTRELESTIKELDAAKQKLENEIAERQKAEEEIKKHAKRLQILDEVSAALVAAKPDTATTLNVVVQRVAELIGEACSINLLSEDRQWWKQVSVYHPDPKILEFAIELANSSPLRFDQGISGLVLKTGEAVILNDLSPELLRTTVSEKYWPFLDRYASFSNLVTPLRLQDRIAGTLVVARYQPNNPYTKEDQIVLQELADRAALALENAALFDEVQQERALLAQRVEERTADLRAANVELTKANRMKDEFLATMSHELRTPLNAILGISEALQERIYGDLTEKQHKVLRNLEESGRHLLALINDILNLSIMSSGKFELRLATVAVESVCQAGLLMVQPLAQKKQLAVTANFDSRVSNIEADERRLKEMLVNLLGNAIKFTPPGGAIGLEVVGDVENRLARFTVWDTGIGIAPEDIPRLFQPFVQVDSSLTRQYGGAGLGLALVHRMAELHGGKVEVQSAPGKGSRFTILLPWQ